MKREGHEKEESCVCVWQWWLVRFEQETHMGPA